MNTEGCLLPKEKVEDFPFQDKSKILSALKRNSLRMDGYFGKRTNLKNTKPNPKGLFGSVWIFNQIYSRNKEYFEKLRDENTHFSLAYEQVKKSEKNTNRTEVMNELIRKYKEKNYKIPNLSAKCNLFEPSPFIMENSKIKDYYSSNHFADPKVLQKFNRDSLRLERLYSFLNENNYEEDKRKSTFEKRTSLNCLHLNSCAAHKEKKINEMLLKKENIALQNEIKHLKDIKDTIDIFETESPGKIPMKSSRITNREKLSLRLWDKENEFKNAKKGEKQISTTTPKWTIKKPTMSNSSARVYQSIDTTNLPTDASREKTNSTWDNNERNMLVKNINDKRQSDLETIYQKICLRDMRGINEDVKNYFSEHVRMEKSNFDPCSKTVDPNFMQKMLHELRQQITFTNVPEIIKSYTAKNGAIGIDTKEVKKVEDLDNALNKLQFVLVDELGKLTKNE